MAAIEGETIYTANKPALIEPECPQCGEKVSIPVVVDYTLKGEDNGLVIDAWVVAPVSDQPIFDHMLEKHGPPI